MQRTPPPDQGERMFRAMDEWTRSNWEQVKATRELTVTIRDLGEQLQPLAKKLAGMGGLSALVGLLGKR